MIAVVFPGQGSQAPGMGKELAQTNAAASEVFDRVSEATGQDLRYVCWNLDPDELRQTQNAQIALYCCGLAAYALLRPHLPEEHYLAGHSVGEFAAVAASGAMTMETGAKLVQRRGELMASAGSARVGSMAAVLGLEREVLETVCKAASSTQEVVVIANDNCPGQLVISGDKSAVERAGTLASEAGAKRVLPLNVSGAFHSPLMEDSAKSFGDFLSAAPWQQQKLIVYANVTAEPVEHGREWAGLFERQLMSPVRWTESVEAMVRDGVDTFVECGSGEVLCGLIRRISREVTTFRLDSPESLESTLESLGSKVKA